MASTVPMCDRHGAASRKFAPEGQLSCVGKSPMAGVTAPPLTAGAQLLGPPETQFPPLCNTVNSTWSALNYAAFNSCCP